MLRVDLHAGEVGDALQGAPVTDREHLLRALLVERYGPQPYRTTIDRCTPLEQARHRRVLCEAMKNAPEAPA